MCCRAAPEMLWGERCTEKADIYSFGASAAQSIIGLSAVQLCMLPESLHTSFDANLTRLPSLQTLAQALCCGRSARGRRQ